MYEYNSMLVRVIDGDTVALNVDLGFTVHVMVTFRLLGINAPEVRGVEYVAGEASKKHLIELLSPGGVARIIVVKSSKPLSTDKYGRWLGQLYVTDQSGTLIDVNMTMVTDGFAVKSLV